jgi:hypothetical protein
MPRAGVRQPRWDPDARGVGVGDARGSLARLDALRAAAAEAGWVAEDPESHLLPHLVRHIEGGAPWSLVARATDADGTFGVELRWAGAPDADRRTIRSAIYALIGVVAEATSLVIESTEGDRHVFEVVTGMLSDQTGFASHGHTIRLTVARPR